MSKALELNLSAPTTITIPDGARSITFHKLVFNQPEDISGEELALAIDCITEKPNSRSSKTEYAEVTKITGNTCQFATELSIGKFTSLKCYAAHLYKVDEFYAYSPFESEAVLSYSFS